MKTMNFVERLEVSVERRRKWIKPVIIAAIVLILAMWVYIFLLAPKNSAGSIDDKVWDDERRGDVLCVERQDRRIAVRQSRRQHARRPQGSRGESVAAGQRDHLQMLADLAKTQPTTDVGKTIVTKWLEDWHTFLQNRVDYANGLIAGTTKQFGETQIDNAPISDFIGSIADQNNRTAARPSPDVTDQPATARDQRKGEQAPRSAPPERRRAGRRVDE